MLEVICSHCGIRILVPPEVQGRHGVCFNCTQPLQIPSAEDIKRHLDLAFEKGDLVADRYYIIERIGKGGMGVVYRAHDSLVDENVALKFMKPKLLRTESGKRLFIQEAQIARRLRHELATPASGSSEIQHPVTVSDKVLQTPGKFVGFEMIWIQAARLLGRFEGGGIVPAVTILEPSQLVPCIRRRACVVLLVQLRPQHLDPKKGLAESG